MNTRTNTINSDAILMRLGYSSKTGETATFKIEQAAWEKLKANEGKNYVLVLAEIGNDGMPTETEKKPKWNLGERSKWVVQRCKEPKFWQFIYSQWGANVSSEYTAREFLLATYQMQSRKEFDDSRRFDEFIRLTGMWQIWLNNAE